MIREIAEKSWAVAYRDILTPEFMAHELAREYSDAALQEQMQAWGHRFLLLAMLDGSAAVGFVSYHHDETTVTVYKLYLLPEFKSKGGGAALMNRVEADARAAQCRHLELKVNRANPAVAFYRKMGFEIVREVDTPVGNGFLRTDYLMRKTLEGIQLSASG